MTLYTTEAIREIGEQLERSSRESMERYLFGQALGRTPSELPEDAGHLVPEMAVASVLVARSDLRFMFGIDYTPPKPTLFQRIRRTLWGRHWEARYRVTTAWAVLRGRHDCGDW